MNRLYLIIIVFILSLMNGHSPSADYTKSPELPRSAGVIAFEKSVSECELSWLYTDPIVIEGLLIFKHTFRREKHNPYEIEGRFSETGEFYGFLISGIRGCQVKSFEKTIILIKKLLQIMQVSEADISLLNERLIVFCKADFPGRYNNYSLEPVCKGESFLGKLFVKAIVSTDVFEILIINTASEHIKTVIKNNQP